MVAKGAEKAQQIVIKRRYITIFGKKKRSMLNRQSRKKVSYFVLSDILSQYVPFFWRCKGRSLQMWQISA